MATVRPYFARPIEHVQDESGTDFSIDSNDYAIPSGTYANAISLLRALVDQTSEITDIQMSDDDDGIFEIYAGTSGTLSFNNTALRNALGFNTRFATALTATEWTKLEKLSTYVWIPRFTFADQQSFGRDMSQVFTGAVALNGMVAGMGTGITSYGREMTFRFELASHLGREHGASSFEQVRCLDAFVEGALTSVPTIAPFVPTKGFWYYQDINDAMDDCTPSGTEWQTEGGISFAYNETYAFCQFDPAAPKSAWDKSPSLGKSRLLYDVTIRFQTAPCPTFL